MQKNIFFLTQMLHELVKSCEVYVIPLVKMSLDAATGDGGLHLIYR